jgi:Cu/Ag efflux protein CusF
MNRYLLPVAVAALLVGCAPSDPSPATASGTAATPPREAAASAPTSATATGVIESVNATAHTITIAHGPVQVLNWPAMTMTFAAPGVDLGSFERGDRVTFAFTASGMTATITQVTKQ